MTTQAFQPAMQAESGCFFAKLSRDPASLEYSRFLGSRQRYQMFSVAVNARGIAVAGMRQSGNAVLVVVEPNGTVTSYPEFAGIEFSAVQFGPDGTLVVAGSERTTSGAVVAALVIE